MKDLDICEDKLLGGAVFNGFAFRYDGHAVNLW